MREQDAAIATQRGQIEALEARLARVEAGGAPESAGLPWAAALALVGGAFALRRNRR